MDTKTCKKCGWVLSIKDPKNRCPVCHTRFEKGICKICGQYVDLYRERDVCKTCYDTVTRKPDANKNVRKRRSKVYDEWLANIAKISKSYPTLTEEQWLEAVKHFNGCALCEEESVDTRGYFIPFKLGGRYCDWNIIPVCDKCATEIRINPNYFLNRRPEGLTNIINYLGVRIDAALGKDTGSL